MLRGRSLPAAEVGAAIHLCRAGGRRIPRGERRTTDRVRALRPVFAVLAASCGGLPTRRPPLLCQRGLPACGSAVSRLSGFPRNLGSVFHGHSAGGSSRARLLLHPVHGQRRHRSVRVGFREVPDVPTCFAAVVVNVGVMARACKQARRLKLTLGAGPERHGDFLISG